MAFVLKPIWYSVTNFEKANKSLDSLLDMKDNEFVEEQKYLFLPEKEILSLIELESPEKMVENFNKIRDGFNLDLLKNNEKELQEKVKKAKQYLISKKNILNEEKEKFFFENTFLRFIFFNYKISIYDIITHIMARTLSNILLCICVIIITKNIKNIHHKKNIDHKNEVLILFFLQIGIKGSFCYLCEKDRKSFKFKVIFENILFYLFSG